MRGGEGKRRQKTGGCTKVGGGTDRIGDGGWDVWAGSLGWFKSRLV